VRVLRLIVKRYPMFVMVPLLVGIAVVGASMAHTVYQSLSYKPPAASIDRNLSEHTSRPRPGLDQYAVIAQRNLFTSAASGLEEKTQAGKAASSTSAMPFKLKGTVVITAGVSIAIIEDTATKKEELFHENDVVQGFKIVKISRNKMIIDRNGNEEGVEVFEGEQEKPSTGSARGPRTMITGPMQIPLPQQIAPPESGESSTGPVQIPPLQQMAPPGSGTP
jgi:type II secretory pathway component PulC